MLLMHTEHIKGNHQRKHYQIWIKHIDLWVLNFNQKTAENVTKDATQKVPLNTIRLVEWSLMSPLPLLWTYQQQTETRSQETIQLSFWQTPRGILVAHNHDHQAIGKPVSHHWYIYIYIYVHTAEPHRIRFDFFFYDHLYAHTGFKPVTFWSFKTHPNCMLPPSEDTQK